MGNGHDAVRVQAAVAFNLMSMLLRSLSCDPVMKALRSIWDKYTTMQKLTVSGLIAACSYECNWVAMVLVTLLSDIIAQHHEKAQSQPFESEGEHPNITIRFSDSNRSSTFVYRHSVRPF